MEQVAVGWRTQAPAADPERVHQRFQRALRVEEVELTRPIGVPPRGLAGHGPGHALVFLHRLTWIEDPTHLERARAHRGRVMLAGGLDPVNVRDAIEAVRPWAVDSARSTERQPGIKNHDAVRAWVAAAR